MMKKSVVAIMVLFGISLSFSAALYAQDVDKTAKDLSSEIGKVAGLTENEQKSINNPVKKMLKGGADKDQIKNAVAGLAKDDIRGEDLKSSAESMYELVKSGNSARDAGNIVSKAAHEAKTEGLKGRDLANKVHEAVKKMQAEKKQQQENKWKEKHAAGIEKHGESGEQGSSMGHGGQGGGRGRR